MGSLSRQTLAYALGTILSKAQGFLLLPILARYLTPADYGTIETVTTFAFLVAIFASLNLDAGIGTFYHDFDQQMERRAIASTGLWLNMLVCVLVAIAAYGWSSQLAKTLGLGGMTNEILVLAVFSALINSASGLQTTLLRLNFNIRHFNLITVGGAIGSSIASLFFVVNLGWGVKGIVVANLLSACLVFASSSILNRAELMTLPNPRWCSKLLAAGVPLLPFTLAAWILSSLDRSMLASYRGLDEVGVYGIAAKFAAVATIFFSPFQNAWWPYAMATWGQPGAAAKFVQALRWFLLIAGFVIVALGSLSPIAIHIFLPNSYKDAARYVGPLVYCSLLIALYFFPLVSLMICKRSWVTSVAYILGAVVNVLLNIYLIPTHGVAGAITATVAGYFVMLLLVSILAHSILPIDYPYVEILFVLIALALLVLLPSVWTTSRLEIMVLQVVISLAMFIAIVLISRLVDAGMYVEFRALRNRLTQLFLSC